MPLSKSILGNAASKQKIHNKIIQGSDDAQPNTNNDREKTLAIISKNIKKYGTSSSTKWLNAEVLLTAPKNFFDKYDEAVEKSVEAIRKQLSDKDQTRIISDAKENPTDEKLQNQTFVNLAAEFVTFTDNTPDGRYLRKQFVGDYEVDILKALIFNDLIGLGPLQPLWDDSDEITEIICNGPYDIQVEIQGNIRKVPSCHFRSPEHLKDLIDVLYTSINKSITVNNPMGRGRLRDKSLMMAVDRSVAPDGPNFNIRRHSDDYWGPKRIVETGEANEEIMTYLGNLIYNGVSFLVIGGTGTGKTTLLDSLTAYYRPNNRIVTLEDNLEMKPHPKKLLAKAMEVVPVNPSSDGSRGVSMRDLVKASLQMRPETIIIGEVTDGAAYDLSNALNTGHSGASTVHANNADAAIYRLMSLILQSDLIKSESAAYALIASAFDIIITVQRFPIDGARRITEISEVGSKVVKNEEGEPSVTITPLWKYVPDTEAYQKEKKTVGTWKNVNHLSQETIDKHYLSLSTPLSWDDLEEIAKL